MVGQQLLLQMPRKWLNGHLNKKNEFYFYLISILAGIQPLTWVSPLDEMAVWNPITT